MATKELIQSKTKFAKKCKDKTKGQRIYQAAAATRKKDSTIESRKK
jgi:hypothetical protein